jgi:hypothetical protein
MMNFERKHLWMILTLLLGIAMTSACAIRIGDFEVQIGDPDMLEVGELRQDVETVPLTSLNEVEVDVTMNAGTMTLTAGSEALMEAEFTYNVDAWQPEVSFEEEIGRAILTVRQPLKGSIQAPEVRNEWSLRFNDSIPMRMFVRLGAGKADLDLRGLNLEDLDIELGAGQVKRGVGEASMILPGDVGVRVNVAGGLGSIETLGLRRQGEYYVNEAYGESAITIDVEILGAIGSIQLEVIE